MALEITERINGVEYYYSDVSDSCYVGFIIDKSMIEVVIPDVINIDFPYVSGEYKVTGIFHDFAEYSAVEIITLPATITRFNGDCFSSATSLKTIYYQGTEAQWNSIEGIETAGIAESVIVKFKPSAATALRLLADEVRVLSGTENAMGLDAMKAHVGEANDEVDSQAELLAQIATALEGKAAGSEQATPIISVNSSGLITATAGDKSGTKQLTTQAAKTITPTKSSQTAVTSGVYTTGVVTVAAIPSTYVKPTATKSATTYTPTTSNQTIAAGTYCSGTQTIKGDSNLVAENIKSGVSIFGVDGSLESGGDGIEMYSTTLYSGSAPFYILDIENNRWAEIWGDDFGYYEAMPIPYGIVFFIDGSGLASWNINGGGAIVMEIFDWTLNKPTGFLCKFTEDGGSINIIEDM